MGMQQHKIVLNDYTIAFEGDPPTRLAIDGPDEAVATQIGRRFLDLLGTKEGRRLMLDLAVTSDVEHHREAVYDLIDALGVPPCGGN